MPPNDFKQRSSSERFKQIWIENKGNWLVATGLVVSILAWSIGYFDLIPEVTAVRRSGTLSLLATGKSLIVRIAGCASDEGRVVAMLYDAENFSANSVATRIVALPIEHRAASWSIHNLQFGVYVVFAFHDVDDNEVLDPQKERQGFSRHPTDTDPLVTLDQPALSQFAFRFDEDDEEIVVQLQPLASAPLDQ